MQTLKTQFILLLFTALAAGPGKAQLTDSVDVSGRVQWRDTRITGYPTELKAIAQTKQEYVTPIDSNGNYHVRLPVGSYTLAPSRHYHWMGEAFVRINDRISAISFNVPAEKTFTAPVLLLDTIGSPNILPSVGIAHHLNNKQADLVDDFIKKQMAYFEISGASLAIIKNGRVIYSQVYGLADLKSGAGD